MAEARKRIAAGENVMVSAASTGELERFADICHEYELPYRLGELEENATVARLAEEGSSRAGLGDGADEGAAVRRRGLSRREGGALRQRRSVRNAAAASQRSRARPKTASFFSDFSDLKPGDYVVHVDHGIGQFEGLRQMAIEGANGEFMLLRYADDARLYVPLARLDLMQKYHVARRRRTAARPPGHDSMGSAQDAREKIRQRHGGTTSGTVCRAKNGDGPRVSAGHELASANSRTRSSLKKRPTSSAPSKT